MARKTKNVAVAVSGASPLTDSDSNFSEPNSALTDAVLIRKARGLANGLSMVRLKCTLCTGADTFSPGTVTEMDEADADSLAKSGYAEKIPVTRTASESPAQEQS